MRITIPLLFLFVAIIPGKAQIFGTEEMIENEKIVLIPWRENDIEAYAGTYTFGESEGESALHLCVANGMVCAQLEKGDWVMENSEINGWRMFYENFTNVKINGYQFYSDQSNGKFVTFEYGNRKHKGLKLVNPPVQTGDEGDYEIGQYFVFDETGNYFQTKTEIMSLDSLRKKNAEELKIMRNEIFARYHYVFRTKKMSDYFSNQEWYSGYHQDVNSFLTEIEKENIKRIREAEKNVGK